MKRQLLILFALTAMLVGMPLNSADAAGGHGHGRGIGRGIGFRQAPGFGAGLGFGVGGYSDIYGYAELYRELLRNVPYFALHPPVYYSVPVPRTYGYSPFAYPGDVMTPEIVAPVQPVTILNPHVKSGSDTPAAPEKDRTTSAPKLVQPLVVINPFVGAGPVVVQAEQR
jgi:hypothetical protein